MFSWLMRWAGSDFGCATKAIFTSVSIRNSTLSIKSLQKRILLSLPIQFCFCGWPVLLTQFLLLATVQLERTRGWLESSHKVTLHGLSYAQKDIPGGYVRILTTFLWKPCAERSACACTDQCSGTQEVHWGTWDLAEMLHDRHVHRAFIPRLRSSEVQALGGSQEEILDSVQLLLAPHVFRADWGISLNARHSILSPALQETWQTLCRM